MNIEAPNISQIRAMSTKKLHAYCVLTDWSDELATEELAERHADEEFESGFREDTTRELQHCDDWGTGEGRYHGRM